MLDTIYDDLIGKLSSVKDFKDILPHTVFVEDDEEERDPDNQRRYHRYFLHAVLPHGQACYPTRTQTSGSKSTCGRSTSNG